MLYDRTAPSPLRELDEEVFRVFVPMDHPLRIALRLIPWDEFHELLAPYYQPKMGALINGGPQYVGVVPTGVKPAKLIGLLQQYLPANPTKKH